MTETSWELPEVPGVNFTASVGSGGVSGMPSNSIWIRGTMANPYYDPDYDYTNNVDGFNAATDRWKRHTETLVVISLAFEGPNGPPVPADPPPADPDPTPGQEPTDG